MSKFIGMTSADHIIESIIYRWVVVPDDKLRSITVLGGDFVITKSTVNRVSPIIYHCRIFSMFMFVCLCVCYWPPVVVVCPNHEVLVFQPCTVTTPDLGPVTYFYVA